jgi:hypothetical protein
LCDAHATGRGHRRFSRELDNNGAMRAAIKFTWNEQLPSDEEVGADPATRYSEDYGEQWNYQATQPVAKAVQDSIANVAGITGLGELYFGEHAWNFDANLGSRQYRFEVYWVPEADGKNAFCARPSPAPRVPCKPVPSGASRRST